MKSLPLCPAGMSLCPVLSWMNDRLGDKHQTVRKNPCLSPGRQPDDKGELAPSPWQWQCQGTEKSRQDVPATTAERGWTEIARQQRLCPEYNRAEDSRVRAPLWWGRSPSPEQWPTLEQASPECCPGCVLHSGNGYDL